MSSICTLWGFACEMYVFIKILAILMCRLIVCSVVARPHCCLRKLIRSPSFRNEFVFESDRSVVVCFSFLRFAGNGSKRQELCVRFPCTGCTCQVWHFPRVTCAGTQALASCGTRNPYMTSSHFWAKPQTTLNARKFGTDVEKITDQTI